MLEDQILVRGSYRKPKVSELAIVQVWYLPYYLYQAIRWQIQWIYKYSIQKEEYSQVWSSEVWRIGSLQQGR